MNNRLIYSSGKVNDIIYQIIQQRTRHFAWLLERIHKVPYCCVAGMYKTWYSQHRNERQNQTNYTWKWHLSFICGSIELVFSDGTMKDSSESEARITEWMRTTWCHFLALISHIFCFFFRIFISTSSFKLETQHHWWRCRLHISFLPPKSRETHVLEATLWVFAPIHIESIEMKLKFEFFFRRLFRYANG